MPIPNEITRTVELSHAPESVWTALTTADGLGGWFGTWAEIDLRPGGRARLRWDQYDAEGVLDICVVEPPTRFAFTWGIEGLPPEDPRRTYVQFDLVPVASGTALTVTESGFAQLPDELRKGSYDGNVEGWRVELGELVEWLSAH